MPVDANLTIQEDDGTTRALRVTDLAPDSGTFGYDAGTAAGTVNVPAEANLRRVSVIAGSAPATVTIGGGDTITIPAGGGFDEDVPGQALGSDVVLGGDVDAYYVSWVS